VSEAIHVTREALKRMPPPRPSFSAAGAPAAPRAPRPQFTIRELIPASIFSRTRDIVAANVAELLDGAEDPAKMIRLIVVEMEETLVEARAASARTIADQKDLRGKIARLERMQAGWLEKAELALAKGREDLAKAALVEKQKAAATAEALAEEVEGLDANLRASETDVARVEAKLREARSRQKAIQARMDSANRQTKLREMYAGPKIDEAFSRFALLDRRVDEAEARAEALGLGAPARTLEEEIAELGTADKVEAELEAMKARLGAQEGE
jgi:phage shock protein A